MSGLWISFEGSEGVGKGTQLGLLQKKLESCGRQVTLTREPGGTQIGEEIRHLLKHHPSGGELNAVPRAELLLFMAARALSIALCVRKALEASQIILSDRSIDSSTVYQGMGRNLGVDNVEWLNNFATDGLKPHITFLIDLPVEVSFERVRQRNKASGKPVADRLEDQELGFFETVRRGYLELAQKEPNRMVVVDGTPSDPQIIAKEIWKYVEPRLA